MQQFVLDEHLEIMFSESGEFMDLARDDLISAMLRMHAANSSRKWRLLIKNAKMEESDLTLSTYVQNVEDFRFWINMAGRTHRLPDKEIAKYFVSGLKPDVFRFLGPSIPWRMLSGKRAKNYLRIGIYWRYLSESKEWNLKKNFINPGKIFRQRFQQGSENNFLAGACSGGFKKSGS